MGPRLNTWESRPCCYFSPKERQGLLEKFGFLAHTAALPVLAIAGPPAPEMYLGNPTDDSHTAPAACAAADTVEGWLLCYRCSGDTETRLWNVSVDRLHPPWLPYEFQLSVPLYVASRMSWAWAAPSCDTKERAQHGLAWNPCLASVAWKAGEEHEKAPQGISKGQGEEEEEEAE